MKPDSPVDPADPRCLMSALADGEADADSAERACAAWADADAAARRSWHVYHLIGDTLRSDDLAVAPGHDLAFLERLRERLADEPVVLAPPKQPLRPAPAAVVPIRRRSGWAWPLAMAASVMAVTTGLVLTQSPVAGGVAAESRMAAVSAGATVAVAQPAVPSAAALEQVPQGSRVVRDAQLDRYLRAHREYGAALPGSLPGGAGLGITAVSFDR